MSNAIFHNKWHGFNHFTVPLEGYPDSATDPIASIEFPFRGIFYNNIPGNFGLSLEEVTINSPGSGFTLAPSVSLRVNPLESLLVQPLFKVGINSLTKTISSIVVLDGGNFFNQGILVFTPAPGDTILRPVETTLTYNVLSAISNSYDWYFYSNLTNSNSADWNKYFSVRDTSEPLSGLWDLGYSSYLTLCGVSSFYESVFTQTTSLSPETSWDGIGGTGWHIALSSITHRTNVPYQIDTRQKVARPVRLTENKTLSTITWDLSAQTVFFSLTGTETLTARDVINPKRGGKYVMWVYVDRCPVKSSRLFFDPKNYNISVKNLDGSYTQTTNLVAITANYITRIDFVYDGNKMLGKASRYRIFAPTEDDLYFQGSGISITDPSTNRNKSPVYINPSNGKALVPATDEGIDIQPFSTSFTETSSFYIAGSGIRFSYLNADNQYFNFTLVNPEFQSKENLTRYKSLTGSFDKVIGTLSGNGDWRLSQFAQNLIASPNEANVTDDIILTAFPTSSRGGPWTLQDSAIRSVRTCLSSYTIEVYSGKNRDISSIIINDASVPINPIVPITTEGNCYRQPYTFLNERTASLTFERISTDFDIVITYQPQVPILIPNLIAWMIAQDNTSLSYTNATSALTTWRTNTPSNFSITQPFQAIAPIVQTENGVRRFINFSGDRSMRSGEGSSLTPLTALSGRNSFMKEFTTFTVFKTLNTFPLSSVVWWVGDLFTDNRQGGYGLVLSGNQLYTIGNFVDKYQNRRVLLNSDPTNLTPNSIQIIATKYNPNENPYRQEIYVNGRRSVYQRSFFDNTVTQPVSNLNLIIGKHPVLGTAYGRFLFYDLYIYDRALSLTEIRNMNNFLIRKFSLYSNVCGGQASNIDELPQGFVPCDNPVLYRGQLAYPSPDFVFNLGTSTGWVELTYDSYTVPDRFLVVYNGNVVIDTGYVGARSYDIGGFGRTNFTNSLQGKIDPITSNPYPDFVNYPQDGYPRVLAAPAGSPGGGKARFFKSTQTPISVIVRAYAPIPGTAWEAELSCPIPNI